MPQSIPPHPACHASPSLAKLSSKTERYLRYASTESTVSTEGMPQVRCNACVSQAAQNGSPAGRSEVHGGPGRPFPTNCRQRAHPSHHSLRETGHPLPTLFRNLLQSLCETPACPLPSIFSASMRNIYHQSPPKERRVISSPVYSWISLMFKIHHEALRKKRKNQ